jgi:2-polyprenyl-3-methyl-5-hydroxy-6-metoxy-1,4-benzoquinol methylase
MNLASSEKYTDKRYWDTYIESYKPKIINSVLFADMFKRFLAKDSTKSILEIGCAGGEFLCYLAKNFRYKAYGIDFSDGIEKTRETFICNGLAEPILYKEDFFTWVTERQFDVVCSFGFIEHFEDLDMVIKKHALLVKPGGILIITLPNLANLQYVFHWLIDREILKRHNIKVMNLKLIRKSFNNLPFTIQYLSYYKPFMLWTDKKPNWREKCIILLFKVFGAIIKRSHVFNRPNAVTSPFIVCISKKNRFPRSKKP